MRCVVLVIDSFGIGALPDAEQYGDADANTALHICEAVKTVSWPNLARLGLGQASELIGNPLPQLGFNGTPEADFGVMMERSAGKDTTTGHWELMGVPLAEPFHEFSQTPPSFPSSLIEPFRERFNCEILGNEAASGTEIISRLGEAHLEQKAPIVYTSADSVFQIACHEDIFPPDQLYQMCGYIRELCDEQGLRVGRVIARPFIGAPGAFERTSRRKDFSMKLPEPGLLDKLSNAGVRTRAIGKIGDIFAGQGIDDNFPEKGNPACLKRTLELLKEEAENPEFIFVNLVDTDMIYGHRRDPQGYHDAVAAIDAELPNLMEALDTGDWLIITADHGCDPTYRGTDHTREHVPLLIYEKGRERAGASLGVRDSFADLAATLAQRFETGQLKVGTSVYS